MRVVIVGAGIIGASIAYHLAKAGVHVRIFDAGKPGQAASGQNFGWINASFAETDAYYELRRDAIGEWSRLQKECDLGSALSWHGALWWEDQGAEFENQLKVLQRRGYPSRIVQAAGFSDLEPSIFAPPAQAILGEVEAGANGAAITALLLKTAGIDVVENCEVARIVQLDGKVVGVETASGFVEADQVIVAAGIATQKILADAGRKLPMSNQPGILVKTTPLPQLLKHIIMSSDVHFRQMPNGQILMGEIFSGGNLAGRSKNQFAAEMLNRLKAWLPAASNAQVAEVIEAVRPVPADGLPAIGPMEQGLYVATMHSGITLAPIVGRLVAEEISGQPANQLGPFRPDRF